MKSQDIESLYRQYKSDSTIMAIHGEIYKVFLRATPHVVIDLSLPSIIKKIPAANFDIDESSKFQIEYWKERLKEYISANYKELNIRFYD